MKILFLDIDGVLVTARSTAVHGPTNFTTKNWHQKFDRIGVELIKKVCKETGAMIVLSSTWRKFISISETAPLGLPIIGYTPVLDIGRGAEIKDWLDMEAVYRGANHLDKVTHYCILDDDDGDMLPEQLGHFVHCSEHDGISYKNYKDVLTILGAKDIQ